MFKTKWQKKYEKAMENIEFWKQFYRDQADKYDEPVLTGINTAQALALSEVLRDMKRIAKS